MIKPYLRDLMINDHISVVELDNEEDNSDKDFKDTCTVYSANKPVEVFMGTDTDGAINKLSDTLL